MDAGRMLILLDMSGCALRVAGRRGASWELHRPERKRLLAFDVPLRVIDVPWKQPADVDVGAPATAALRVDLIVESPVGVGESLKGGFYGYHSAPLKMNFLIIYLYCINRGRRGDDEIVRCHDCSRRADETVTFVQMGPHDEADKEPGR